MNQKYLQGLSSNMGSLSEAVFFEATPENISAFLMGHQSAQTAAVGTTDDRTFLTAKMGFIDVCPDQEYLVRRLLPIYSKVQLGSLPTPSLKTVSREAALAEGCPRPDWNYLRWAGYSDKKYHSILNGEALLELQWYGETVSLELQVRSYYNAGKLALQLADWSDGEPEDWADLTVNLGCSVEKDCAFVDINDLGEEILAWVEKNGLGKPTGRSQRSGFVVYPEYRFDAGRLRELDDYGYQEYSRIFEQANRAQHPRKKDSQER